MGYQIYPAGGGGGPAVPGTTVIGDIVTWNSTSGAALADSGIGIAYVGSTTFSLAVGASNTITTNANTTVFGTQITSPSGETSSTIFGNLIFAGASGSDVVVGAMIGTSAAFPAGTGNNTIVGHNILSTLTGAGGSRNVLIGNNIGATATSRGGSSVAVGVYAGNELANNSVNVGYSSGNGFAGETCLGYQAGGNGGDGAGGSYSIQLGANAGATGANQFVVGSHSSSAIGKITDVYIGRGVSYSGTLGSVTYHNTNASGTDASAAASSIIISPGAGTGAGDGAPLLFTTAPAGLTGSSVNPQVVGGQLTTSGGWILGPASATPTHALNTNSTTGTTVCTLGTNSPSVGVTPTGWIAITINGTLSYIPYFQ